MIKIVLEPVDNGIIRTIIDDNDKGAGELMEKKEIFVTGDNVENTERFLKKLISDLGLYTGNPVEEQTLYLGKTYGKDYQMSHKEIFEEEKRLNVRLNQLRNLKEETA